MKLQCDHCGRQIETLKLWLRHNADFHNDAATYSLVREEGDLPPGKPTPKLADECKKLLDNGWDIQLFKNKLGSYTAAANHATRKGVMTDDFEPSAALYRLTEKVYGNIV
jgi:hypothetical protein